MQAAHKKLRPKPERIPVVMVIGRKAECRVNASGDGSHGLGGGWMSDWVEVTSGGTSFEIADEAVCLKVSDDNYF